MKKKIIAISMTCLLLGTSLIGCSGSGQPSSSGNTSQASGSGDKPVTLNYYTWYQSTDGSYPDNMITAFEKKYPNIKVNLEVGSQNVDEYLETQKVKLLSGKDVDVTSVRAESYKNYVNAGYLMDLTGEPYLNNFSNDYVKQITVGGKVYGVPYAMDVYGCIYNKTMFEKNGWKVPSSYEDFQSLCKKIAATGITPTVQGYKDSWPLAQDIELFMNPVVVADPEIYSKIDSGKAKYTDKGFVDAVTRMNDFFHSPAVSKQNMALTYDQSAAYFASGKAAMIMHGEWIMDSIKSAKPDFEIGVCPAPLNKQGTPQRGVVAITSTQCIAKNTQHPKEAKLFEEYMSSVEGASLMDQELGNFTPVNGVQSKKKDLWKDALNLPFTDFCTDFMYTGVSSEMYKSAQKMISGEMNPEQMCQAMQSAQDKKG